MSAERTPAEVVNDLRGTWSSYLDQAQREAAADLIERLNAENERLRLAILDIDAHATPLGEDDEGFVAIGYAISVGSLHRSLGLVGHTAPRGVTTVDLESDFITMLYDLVPQEVGIPIGASALIWRAARELEAINATLPDCPTCGGKGDTLDLICDNCGASASLPFGMTCSNHLAKPSPCPACDGTGKVSPAQLVALWQAVHDVATAEAVAEKLGATVYAGRPGRERDSWLLKYATIMVDYLRAVRPT